MKASPAPGSRSFLPGDSWPVTVFLVSIVYVFAYFWLGSVFIANPHTEAVPLHLPRWDEWKWWLGRPDTGWYFSIIEKGYQPGPYSAAQTNWVFFPAWPLLVRFLSPGLHGEPVLVVGWVTAMFCYAASLWLLNRLLVPDFDRQTVLRAILLVCFYPFAFSLAIFGPDSLFLLAVCAAFYGARRQWWWLSGLAAALAGATRAQGILVFPCLLLACLRKDGSGRPQASGRSLASVAPVLLAPMGLIAFSAYLWRLTGNPLAFGDAQKAWGNGASWPFAFLVHFLQSPRMIGHGGWDPEFLSVLATCLLIPLLVWTWTSRRLRAEYVLFFALQVAVLVCRESTLGNLRYVTGCFPCFLALALLVRREMTFSLVLALFAGLLGLCSALFAAGELQLGYRFMAF